MKRTSLYYKLKEGSSEMAYYSACIPPHIWKIDASKFVPAQFSKETKNKTIANVVTVDEQKTWIKRFTSDFSLLKRPYLLCMGSEPTNDIALACACCIARFAIDYSRNCENKLFIVKVINLAIDYDFKRRVLDEDAPLTADPDLLVLHNVDTLSPSNRRQRAIDLLSVYSESFRIIVTNGEPFAFERFLRTSFHGVFYFNNDSIMRYLANEKVIASRYEEEIPK